MVKTPGQEIRDCATHTEAPSGLSDYEGLAPSSPSWPEQIEDHLAWLPVDSQALLSPY